MSKNDVAFKITIFGTSQGGYLESYPGVLNVEHLERKEPVSI